jgi:putative FmdB family regulatory protein
MPIYVYECKSCGAVQEKLLSVSEMQQSVDCECGSVASKRFSAPSRVWAPTRSGQ